MVVERTINVGFHSDFGAFKRNRHSKTLTRLAITNGFPFNPTYESDGGRCPPYSHNSWDGTGAVPYKRVR